MEKYVIDGATLEGLGDSIRSVTGSTKKFTPDEMIEEVKNILDATTFILVDTDGNEYPAVYVDSDTVCTATANDIRKGSVAITPEGVIEGTKEIPTYRAVEGYEVVKSGRNVDIFLCSDMCQYTVLQAIVCRYGTGMKDSVSSEKVVIDGLVYNVGSTEVLSTVAVDVDTQTIKLGINNDSESPVIVRYMIIKEDE
jgi:hypothetical protein